MSIPTGPRLGHHDIVAALGEGGMGEVCRVRDPQLDRDVAIKVLSAVDGETVRARLAGGALSSRQAIGYALQIAKGMAAAHGRGIVLRDLKPENVMITRDDQVKILDFGLAKPIDGAANQKSPASVVSPRTRAWLLGTFGYMAPEQVRGLAVDPRADMFAFGAVLYEMLTGERAFKGETAAGTMTAILTKDPPDLDPARLSISPRSNASSGGASRRLRSCGFSRRPISLSRSRRSPPSRRHHWRRWMLRHAATGAHVLGTVGVWGRRSGRGTGSVDRETGARGRGSAMGVVSPDNRTIDYGAARYEADIWIVERK